MVDVLSSTEFRKRFASLTSLTVVTVNGHTIGEWTPVGVGAPIAMHATEFDATVSGAPHEAPTDVEQRVTNILDEIDRAQHLSPRSFPEFRPAPKPGRK